jgi:hypothetical protein
VLLELVPPLTYYFAGAPSAKKLTMTNDPALVHHLTAFDLFIGASASPAKRRQRKATLAAPLKAARKAGPDRVEIVDGKIVIALAGESAKPNGNSAGSSVSGANPWDIVLPGGDYGAD